MPHGRQPVCIEVNDATVAYGGNTVLDRISLTLRQGTITGLVGPNGVGKTTLLRLVAGLIPGHSTCVSVMGKPVDATTRRGVFYLDGESLLDERLSGLDYLRYVKAMWRSPAPIKPIIEAMGVSGFVRKPIRRLSQGMRQQVCFAMAMVSGAKLMLLDEPMNALDPSNALSASRLLREQCSGGATVLLSTHLLQGLDSLADQVLFLDRGRIAYVRDKDDARPTAEVYADLYLDAMNVGDA